MGEALEALERVCDDVRFLGSYPRADGRENRPRRRDDAAFADAAAWLARSAPAALTGQPDVPMI